ncbi:hypothetical protein Misp01_08160 [Microtetraspora sp. NBRC 13810]|uniref:nuclear transport factor 2 family protein n=1 Tax=Microtetraspora sp. NBRC 13810 TaxID=3030990 RepID=UPI0024A47A63|nr:nuclear transport factor 2 family protein [Microtetraspora sp. NBRC 13810]GLW05686.1 hypothetical protein Misp01_08160 [Microtetraspora sp. NBRC 13810]
MSTDLHDRLELAELVSRLSHLLDDPADDDGLRAVYAENAVVNSPRGTAEGIDAVIAFVRRGDGGERTHHFTTDVVVDLDGDRAVVRASLIDVFYRPGETPHRTVGLRYVFGALRTARGWRFDRADITPVWFSPQP